MICVVCSQFGLDDPLDAVAVHGGGGVVGVLCAPFFSYQTGIFWTSEAWTSLGMCGHVLKLGNKWKL